MVVRPLAKLATAAGRLAARGGQEAFVSLLSATKETNAGIIYLVDRATDMITPEVIVATCYPDVDGEVDDFEVDIDARAFIEALEAGKLVRPVIEIRAVSDELDRDLLAERLIEALRPVSDRIQSQAEAIKERQRARLAREESDAAWAQLEFEMSSLILTLATGGAYLLVLIGLMGISAIAELPSILFRRLKQTVGLKTYDQPEDRELEALRDKLARDEAAVRKAVMHATIIVDQDIGVPGALSDI